MASKMTVTSQQEATAAVRAIAQEHGLERVLWGTGGPYRQPHVQAVQRYFSIGISCYPKGSGYGMPCTYYTVVIEPH